MVTPLLRQQVISFIGDVLLVFFIRTSYDHSKASSLARTSKRVNDRYFFVPKRIDNAH